MGAKEIMLTIGITYLLCVATIPVAIGFMDLVEEGELPTLSQIWNYSTRTLTNLNNTRASKIDRLDASISSVLDAIGEIEVGEGGATASDIWTYETRTLTSGLGNLDTTVSSRSTQSSVDTIDDYIDTEIGTLQTDITAIKGYVDTEIGTLQTDVTAIKGYVDTEIGTLQTDVTAIKGYVDTEIGTLQTTLDSSYSPIGYNAVEAYTTFTPIQNTWYTAIDVSNTHGYLQSLSVTHGAGVTKQLEIRVTLDGVAFTGSRGTATATTTYFQCAYFSETLGADTVLVPLVGNGVGLPYKTSIKVEYRTTSTSAVSITTTFRRFDS